MVEKMKEEFEITINDVQVGFHIFIDRVNLKLWIRQALYVSKSFKHFGFENATPMSTPADPNIHLEYYLTTKMEKKSFFYPKVVGYLMFAKLRTRPKFFIL